MVYWNCDVKNKRCTHFLPLVAAIIWFWQSKFPVEMRLWVPVLAWYLRTLLNIVSEQLRWAKSSNVLERLHICSCDAAAHWHSSSSESERSLERVSSFESVRNTQCCKKGGCYVPPHACSLPTMSNLSRSPKIYPCAERKNLLKQNLHHHCWQGCDKLEHAYSDYLSASMQISWVNTTTDWKGAVASITTRGGGLCEMDIDP